jgi:hypothetical protein
MISAKAEPEWGGASLLALTFSLLLIGLCALGALEIAHLASRRAEVRKIEALGLTAMERAGGSGALACEIAGRNFPITCEFGGGEIVLRAPELPEIPVGWRGQSQALR